MAATLQSSVLGYAAGGLGVYGVMGQVPWRMGGVLAAVAAVATLLGHLSISRYIRRTGRFWLILVILAVCSVITTGVAAYNAAVVLRMAERNPVLWRKSGGLCHKAS